jgi:hypothetical protein
VRKVGFLVLALSIIFTQSTAFGGDALSKNPILYIGDSISVGAFGTAIDAALRRISTQVTSEASCGSTPRDWLPQTGTSAPAYVKTYCGYWKKFGDGTGDEMRMTSFNTPQLPEEIKSVHPQLTVVQLGTNIASKPDPMSYLAAVREMLQDIKNAGSQCVWIGPPSWNNPIFLQKNMVATDEMLAREAAQFGCFYVHTMKFTAAPTEGDGVHPKPQLAKQWADAVLRRIRATLQKDIRR